MLRRVGALLTQDTGAACPPGVDRGAFTAAVTEDTYEVLADLELCEAAIVVDDPGESGLAEAAGELVWPGTPVLRPRSRGEAAALAALAAAPEWGTAHGADQVALVAADAPDLPPLLIAKLFRGLARARVAVCPADGGGLVALAARTPLPDWAGGVGLDTPDALDRLGRARPSPEALSVAPGWHRLRVPTDVSRLDPGLEGWEYTRRLLGPSSHLLR